MTTPEPSAERGSGLGASERYESGLYDEPSAVADAAQWASMTPQQQLDAYRAALARPATPPLDVDRDSMLRTMRDNRLFMERLKTAIWHASPDDDLERYAEAVAAEYAALANPTPEDT